MKSNRHKWIYDRILRMVPDLMSRPFNEVIRLKRENFMDLVIEKLDADDHSVRISMAHYYEQNGDPMADPEMEIRLWEHGMAEALTFTMHGVAGANGGHLYQEVYPIRDGVQYVNKRLKQQLNAFLDQWTVNLKNQGHTVVEDQEQAA